MMSSLNWVQALAEVEKSGQAWVMATVIGTKGSSPRESASKMVITSEHSFDTIGGGQLEYAVCQKARAILEAGDGPSHVLENFPLAAKTNQCCGGAVSVLLEYFPEPAAKITIFGMGHVATTLVNVLGEMPAKISWVDSRDNLAQDKQMIGTPSNVTPFLYQSMLEHIDRMSANEIALVMTHDHALDYQLVEALLDRKDCRFIGLIGSQTKAMRFKKRLASASFSKAEIDSVHSPVGIPEVAGKKPFEIAISIAGQIIQLTQSITDQPKKVTGLTWKEINGALVDAKGA
ncbi:xanthine dehydrogenase accessory protein XdhC [Marinomonas posidonica]|uniref:Xanthine dehydrogenase accessory protein XdhC n=1 Tax=Marinomonas posidonica (strain CECT 7376 / NCIMB 14433 / IVIA-Po-181) TaxID=491952 RepID=F6CX86_MARPP|nr:xanthine dehydrogenase accessory protein XdhC [Marinomonas posidonica]AEF54439.1 xanthine dehydrogenase accessory protein XdhC [Marinomonas posidonica IVIA-Po-181]